MAPHTLLTEIKQSQQTHAFCAPFTTNRVQVWTNTEEIFPSKLPTWSSLIHVSHHPTFLPSFFLPLDNNNQTRNYTKLDDIIMTIYLLSFFLSCKCQERMCRSYTKNSAPFQLLCVPALTRFTIIIKENQCMILHVQKSTTFSSFQKFMELLPNDSGYQLLWLYII